MNLAVECHRFGKIFMRIYDKMRDNAKFKLGSINGSKLCRTKSRAQISLFTDL